MVPLPDLGSVVAAVEAQTSSNAPLKRLAIAAQVRDELDEVAEGVVDVFGERARVAGCSWGQIGQALGVSKQAAQQRHARSAHRRRGSRGLFDRPARPPTFEHLTDQTRTTMVYASREPSAIERGSAGPEHLLLGVLQVADGIATETLQSMGVSLADVRRLVDEASDGTARTERTTAPVAVPLGRSACELLEGAMHEARQLKHDYIGTEHLLLGLERQRDGLAADVLVRLGVDHDRIRAEVMGRLHQ